MARQLLEFRDIGDPETGARKKIVQGMSSARARLRLTFERADWGAREELTMKFMLMMNAPRGDGEWGVMSWSPEDLKAHIRFMKDFCKELSDAGELVGAEGLAPPGQARLVRAGAAGKPEVTDGPYPEAKEFLAGYWIVDVESSARAYEIAGQASAAPGKGGKPLNMAIEVREVMSGPPVDA